MSHRFFSSILLGLTVFGAGWARAEEKPALAPEQVDFFEKRIRPVLAEQCAKCHSAQSEKIKGGLVIDSPEALLKGGDTGPALVRGEPEKSLLIEAVRYGNADLQMPPKHRLEAQQVHDLEEWVKMGAPDPRTGAEPAAKRTIDFEKGRAFWSFQPVKDPAPPVVQDANWARNPIDQFVLAKLEARGLPPNGDAEKRTLLRRATYDLTGLPPTPEELRAFADDTAPDAFARVVERLLATPAYGEKWGRHWLDLVRYADTSGCNSDFPVPSAYRYRNYVIDAFNKDKPYDRFLREQIAGDLLPARDDGERQEQIIATGYLAIARRFGSGGDEFHLTVEDLIDNLGKATLGLSVNCARCHDHKFDPISAADYYALYGIFDSTKFAFPGTELFPRASSFTPLITDRAKAAQLLSESDELGNTDRQLNALKEEKKRNDAGHPEDIEGGGRKRTNEDVACEVIATKLRQAELAARVAEVPKAYAVHDGTAHAVKLQKKGDPQSLGDEVPRGFLTVLGGQKLPPDEHGSGRRELADWIVDPANPLTARVMVNRIWQGHFGHALVKTPNDFGVRGETPTHPELLDWLASRFVASGWSIKEMHRTIMLSRAYQMSADDRADGLAEDVNNDLLWKFNRRRLDAEELRDAILAIAGTLDRTPGERPPFPPEKDYHYTQHVPFVADYPSARRAVYLMQQRIRKQPFLQTFDGADTNAATAIRPLTTTPLQALWMMNDAFAHEQAGKFAQRLSAAFSDDAARIQLAFELAFARPAQPEEVATAQASLADLSTALGEAGVAEADRPAAALASFTRVLLSSNEFAFLD